MNEDMTFGSFLQQKRKDLEPHITLRKMAELLAISPTYMSQMENNRLPAPGGDLLSKMCELLKLTGSEAQLMYDLAASSNKMQKIPEDLPDYINQNKYAKIALRVAKDVDATDDEWVAFIEKLKKRGQPNQE